MQMRHDASLKDQKADVEALLQKQNAFAAREEKERLVLLERLDAVQEDEEVINMVKTEVYQVRPRSCRNLASGWRCDTLLPPPQTHPPPKIRHGISYSYHFIFGAK